MDTEAVGFHATEINYSKRGLGLAGVGLGLPTWAWFFGGGWFFGGWACRHGLGLAGVGLVLRWLGLPAWAWFFGGWACRSRVDFLCIE
uniref:Uncharacterized protein n=1 Tax=Fagus sylvatica TaxID=28930 RepID=A0A2N9FEY7_FAGSY